MHVVVRSAQMGVHTRSPAATAVLRGAGWPLGRPGGRLGGPRACPCRAPSCWVVSCGVTCARGPNPPCAGWLRQPPRQDAAGPRAGPGRRPRPAAARCRCRAPLLVATPGPPLLLAAVPGLLLRAAGGPPLLLVAVPGPVPARPPPACLPPGRRRPALPVRPSHCHRPPRARRRSPLPGRQAPAPGHHRCGRQATTGGGRRGARAGPGGAGGPGGGGVRLRPAPPCAAARAAPRCPVPYRFRGLEFHCPRCS